ncbi:DNA-binding transcriptional MerR regulator [Deinococcus metalli]|uniref:DNA-binding transcriptional MerR regulator n=1 Tax=Deinococcus metalli TaxID=1141878 RepID=A0A7W8NP82_9DEIO|nr:helix-turn-helix domain-containing protein [Deinococcus metalli]MBB5377719.1 DNA-binding transcriptional MerR regulator [Deinococcus metalli]GHF52818.1 MerR family transcriptional regulator [Deinococcus metalli]
MTQPTPPSPTAALMGIGAFAQATRLSLKALRLYDDLGLLPPAHVDAQTGYRHYHPDQLGTARVIGLLRQLDMPLSTIRSVLDAPAGARPTLIRGYWEGAERQHGQHRALAQYVLNTLEGATMQETFTVHTRDLPTRQLATIQRRVFQPELDGFLPPSIGRLIGFIPAQGAVVAGAPFVIYHGAVTADSDGPVEVCVPYTGALTPTGDITLREEAAHHEAYVTVTRRQFEFPTILEAFDATGAYADAHGGRSPLTCREVYPYAWDGAGPDDPAGEVAWPYTPSAT